MSVFKKKDVKIALYISIASFILLILMIIFWKNVITKNVNVNLEEFSSFLLFILLGVLTFYSFFVFIGFTETLIIELVNNHKQEKILKLSVEQIQKLLSPEYFEIKFKDFENAKLTNFISEEDIHCFAKLDENGNLVYKIQVDVEKTSDDYVQFTNNFEIRNQ